MLFVQIEGYAGTFKKAKIFIAQVVNVYLAVFKAPVHNRLSGVFDAVVFADEVFVEVSVTIHQFHFLHSFWHKFGLSPAMII